MESASGEFVNSNMLEKGLLAHLLRRCSEHSDGNVDCGRRIVGVISSIVQRESFQNPVLGRIFAAVKLWSSDSSSCLAAELFTMFQYVGDKEASKALVDLSCAPYPDNNSVVAVAIQIRELADYRENARLEEEARGLWAEEECERGDTNHPDEDEEW